MSEVCVMFRVLPAMLKAQLVQKICNVMLNGFIIIDCNVKRLVKADLSHSCRQSSLLHIHLDSVLSSCHSCQNDSDIFHSIALQNNHPHILQCHANNERELG